MLPQVSGLGERALDILFPKRCIDCGKEGSFICVSCRNQLHAVLPPICPLCGRPQSSGILCPDCVTWQSDIDSIRSPFRFEGIVRKAVHHLKYKNLRAIAPLMSILLFEHLQRYPLSFDVIVPVPLHEKRIRERGYNQSFLLARELGKLTGCVVDSRSLIKYRPTSPQARTHGVIERKTNVAQAFTIHGKELTGRKVLLIDDVATSGATLDACACELKKAGVETVLGLTFAREI